MAGAAKKVVPGAASPTPAAETQTAGEIAATVKETLQELTPVAIVEQPVVPVHISIDALVEALKAGENRAEIAGLRVVGPRKGRRRIGRAFGPEAVIIPLINLGQDELRSIDEDKELSWSVVPLPEDEGED